MVCSIISLLLSIFLLSPVINAQSHKQKLLNGYVGQSKVLKVREELLKAEIIPTVIDDFIPALTLLVSWPSNHTAELGNTIDPDDVQDAPTIKLHVDSSASSSSLSGLTYTVVLTNPDAPSREDPEWSEMCHWIATKVAISSKSTSFDRQTLPTNSKKPKEIMPWKPPGPPPKTGKHRYVFLAFAPANGTTKKLKLSKPDDRQHWGTGKERHGVRDWAEVNGLVPVAANFIYSQNEKQ